MTYWGTVHPMIPNIMVLQVRVLPRAPSMKQAKTKYPIVISGKVYPVGTVVDVLKADDPLVTSVFPAISAKPNSPQIAVRFPNRRHVSIGLRKSFELT